MKWVGILLVVVLCTSGCYKTVYMNVQGNRNTTKMTLEKLEKIPAYDEATWQHFFIWGWVPSEKIIEASKFCGGSEHIAGINTKQTFVQRLVEMVASYYINIYSPYDGHVVCDNTALIKKEDTL